MYVCTSTANLRWKVPGSAGDPREPEGLTNKSIERFYMYIGFAAEQYLLSLVLAIRHLAWIVRIGRHTNSSSLTRREVGQHTS